MTKILKFAAIAACVSVFIYGCEKNDLTTTPATTDVLTTDEIQLIKSAGFSPEGAYKEEGKFVIEGDILMSAEELRQINPNSGTELIIANDEHYRTTNLVTGLPRVIKIKYTGGYATISTALNTAISRYNARGLQITFQRVTTGQHITVTTVSNVSYIASSGFPSGGNPYNSVKWNTAYTGWNANTMASVMAHEIGHCIGFRHTDYMQREYSCGGAHVNEGSAGVGAIHIPGTPTTPSAGSWMLACISNGVNRPFTASDKVALAYVY